MATEETKQETPTVEKQTNCLGCSKPLKKVRRYYRDNKYYCTKKCWYKAIEKAKTTNENK